MTPEIFEVSKIIVPPLIQGMYSTKQETIMTKTKTKTETTGEKKSATPNLNNESPLETKKSKTKSKTKTKTKKPNIQITRTINISSLVTDCVYDVENRIQSYADNNDIQFSKDEITKIMKAIKEQLK